MTIQKLTLDDIKQQAQVHSLSFRKAYKGIIPDSFLDKFTVEQREKFFTRKYEEYKDTYTIKNNSQLIGFSTIGRCRDDDKDQDTGEVRGIYIHPDYWRSGYGSHLFDHVVSELFNRNYTEITLWVLELNWTARLFYEYKRFQFDGTKKEITLGKDLIEMRYCLKK